MRLPVLICRNGGREKTYTVCQLSARGTPSSLSCLLLDCWWLLVAGGYLCCFLLLLLGTIYWPIQRVCIGEGVRACVCVPSFKFPETPEFSVPVDIPFKISL